MLPGGTGGSGAGPKSKSRSRSRSPEDGKSPEVEERQLAAFRERYPVDDRAFDFLQKQPAEVQQVVVSEFKPRHEGQDRQDNYSALLTNFIRQVRGRLELGRRRKGLGASAMPTYRSTQDRGGAEGRCRERTRGRERGERRRGRHKGRGSRERRRRRDVVSSGCSSSSSSSGIGPGSESEDAGGGSVAGQGTSSGRSSSSSGSTSGSRAEAAAKKAADSIVARAIAESMEEERRKVNEAEAEAMKVAGEKIERVVSEAEEEMRTKLAEYEDMLRAEKESKIDQVTKLADASARERIKSAVEEAQAERQWRIRCAETEADSAARRAREDREKRHQRKSKEKEERAKQKAERAKAKEKVGHEEIKLKVKKKRKKVAEDVEDKHGRRHKGRQKKAATKRGRLRLKEDRDLARSRSCDMSIESEVHARPWRRGRAMQSEDSEADDWRRESPGDSRSIDSRDDVGAAAEAASYERGRRRRARERARDRSSARPRDSELRAFRDRYPMDERAFASLAAASGEVQRALLDQFKPRSEGDDDYSALVSSFLRAIQQRREVGRRGPPPSRRREPPPTPRAETPRQRQDEDSSWAPGENTNQGRNGDWETGSLAAFRERYPMDQRAYSALEQAPSGVQNVVMSDFKPRREGESDYSALIMAFVRAVQLRVGSGRGRERDDEEGN